MVHPPQGQEGPPGCNPRTPSGGYVVSATVGHWFRKGYLQKKQGEEEEMEVEKREDTQNSQR